jgi:hypothetical protein
VVEILLDNGRDPHARTLTGKTPLQVGWGLSVRGDYSRRLADLTFLSRAQCAAFEGYESIVEVLLERGADLNARTSKGRNALYYASRNGHPGVVKLLVDCARLNYLTPASAGASCPAAQGAGASIFSASAAWRKGLKTLARPSPSKAAFLLDKKAALHCACRKGHIKVSLSAQTKKCASD